MTFGENKLMTFDVSSSFGGIKVDESLKANFEIDSNLEVKKSSSKIIFNDASSKINFIDNV